eukprot:m.49036 g.49036  ORF g.49036 m.49036 type:complete len:178 (-) comp6458_c0_seq3:1499-2032(-)
MAEAAAIMEGALVCRGALLLGDITIGSGSVVHPSAVLRAEDGPIVIGDNTLIEEQVEIVNRRPANATGSAGGVMMIGQNNVFEAGSRCEALIVGDSNVFESKSVIGRDVTVGNHCRVGAACTVTANEPLEDHTIVYGPEAIRRKDLSYHRPPAYDEQLVHLRSLLPKFHPIQNATSS